MSGNCSTDINPLEIGCVDDTAEPHKLISRVFPSKIGGKPAWLALRGLPCGDDLRCDNCRARLVFLLQAYCPVESPREDSTTFHRSLFFFMCPMGGCYGNDKQASPIRVFRSQLPRDNAFYPSDPPNYEADRAEVAALAAAGSVPNVSSWQRVCALCGCQGDSSVAPIDCPDCQAAACSSAAPDAARSLAATYCSREHMAADAERHAGLCHSEQAASVFREFAGQLLLELWTGGPPVPGCRLPELGLLIGPDPRSDEDSEDDEDMGNTSGSSSPPCGESDGEGEGEGGATENCDVRADGKQRHNGGGRVRGSEVGDQGGRHRQSSGGDGGGDCGMDEFVRGIEELAAKETPEMRCLELFKRATRREPEQVFRYHRRGQPLLISPQPLPQPPPCELCGSERIFECQLTPQLLSRLGLDGDGLEASKQAPDFGTVLVFTCARSCKPQAADCAAYAREFVAIQYI